MVKPKPLSKIRKVIFFPTALLTLFLNGCAAENENMMNRNAAQAAAHDGYRSSRQAYYSGDSFQFHLNKGFEAAMHNDLDKALEHYSVAVKIKNRLSWVAFSNRGHVYFRRGEFDLAMEDFTRVLELKPDALSAYIFRGNIRMVTRNPQEALADFTRAIEIDPAFADAYVSRGKLLFGLGEFEQANSDFNKSVEIKDDDPSNLIGLAGFLSTCPEDKFRNGSRAVELTLKAIDLTHKWRGMVKVQASPEVMNYSQIPLAPQYEILAAAFAEKGDFTAAEEAQEKAIKLLENENAMHRLPEALTHLRSYREKKARRDYPGSSITAPSRQI